MLLLSEERTLHARLPKYKMAKEAAIKDTKEKAESANPTTTDADLEENDGRSLYSSAVEHAFLSTTYAQWVLDSGATRHFSGVGSDFFSLKR